MSEINNKQIENNKDIDVVIAMYKLIECSDNFSKKPRSLYLRYSDESAPENNCDIADFADNDTTDSLKFQEKIRGRTVYDDTKNVEKMIVMNYLK